MTAEGRYGKDRERCTAVAVRVSSSALALSFLPTSRRMFLNTAAPSYDNKVQLKTIALFETLVTSMFGLTGGLHIMHNSLEMHAAFTVRC